LFFARMTKGTQMGNYLYRRNIVSRFAKVLFISIILLILLGMTLCVIACYYFNVGPFYALAFFSCMYGFDPLLVFPFVLTVMLVGSVVSVRLLPQRFQILAVFVAVCLALGCLLINHLHYPQYDQFTPSRQKLDQVRQWLWQNPPNGKNRAERRKRMAVVQTACDQLRDSVFHEYVWAGEADWTKSFTHSGWDTFLSKSYRTTSEMEAQYPSLYFLGRAVNHAIEDIRTTKVKKGLAVWHMYNMGYVFKTPESCFAIDLILPYSEQLFADIDFLLVTHGHGDHVSLPLIVEMIKAGKPVIQRMPEVAFWESFEDILSKTIIDQPSEFRFGNIRVKVDVGDHHLPRTKDEEELFRDFVLTFQIDCGPSANDCTIYHAGDAGNARKMAPDKNVDVLIINGGAPCKQIVAHLNPGLTFVSHILELGHSPKLPDPSRSPFDFAYHWSMRSLPENKSATLTWGERWLLQDTVLK
jgi:hypothetical protein